MWPWKKKVEPEYIGPPLCICGAEMKITNFDAWDDLENFPTRLTGVYSCPKEGCQGNFKEYHEKRLAVMLKLTDEERKLIGVWTY